jgi:hypothetical protein
MESFEIIGNQEKYKIVRFTAFETVFSVFNYSTCHIIKKNETGKWIAIEHRFGREHIPLNEIGQVIDSRFELV